MSERALRRVLAAGKAYRLNPLYPIKSRRAVVREVEEH